MILKGRISVLRDIKKTSRRTVLQKGRDIKRTSRRTTRNISASTIQLQMIKASGIARLRCVIG